MAAETLGFTQGFDAGYTLKAQLEHILQKTIPLILFTDSKILYDVLTGNKATTEARLMVDLAAARQSYHRREIDAIGLISSADNYADDLSKLRGNQRLSLIHI